MKTLFVTGAEGFTGTHLVQYLRRRGYEVVGGVRNRARKLAFERQHGRAIVCDVSDAINVARAVAGVKPEGIIHLAGMAAPHDAATEPLAAYQSIVTGWANLLDAVRRAVPRARVVMASACEVYGSAGNDGRPLREDTPLRPVNTFGALKATAESIARTFFDAYHMNVSIARPFHYTGPGQSDRSFFTAVARRVLGWNPAAQGDVIEFPDLDCQRELLHVNDVVEAYHHLLEEGRPNEVYNLSSGQSCTVRQMVEAIIRLARQNLRVTPLANADGPPIRALCGDNTKIREQCGWQPTRTMEDAVRSLVEALQGQETTA